MKGRIKEKREIAKGTLLATFDLLGEEVDFTPGQYFFVTLPDRPEAHYDEGMRPRRTTAKWNRPSRVARRLAVDRASS